MSTRAHETMRPSQVTSCKLRIVNLHCKRDQGSAIDEILDLVHNTSFHHVGGAKQKNLDICGKLSLIVFGSGE